MSSPSHEQKTIHLPSETGRDEPIYKPAVTPSSNPEAAAAFIFVHGLADSAVAIENVADQFQQGGKLPWMSWILPNARVSRMTMDTAWFIPNTLPHLAPSRPELQPDEDEEGMLETVAYLESIIDAVVDTGIPPGRIVLGGFSQGCAMSLLTALTSAKYNGKLAGVVGLLGYLPLCDGKERIQELREQAGLERGGESVRTFMARGTKDEFIPKRAWDYTLKALDELGVTSSAMEVKFYDIGHTINGAVLRDVCSWLEKTVPDVV